MTTTERFAQDHNLTVPRVKELVRLAKRIGTTETACHNMRDDTGSLNRANDRAHEQFRKYALGCGFDDVRTDNLYPTLVKGERRFIELPLD